MNDDLGSNKAHLFCSASRAEPGDVLVELGVRDGAGSFTMLEATAGQQCRVIGVDPSVCPFEPPQRYEYLQTDSVTAAAQIGSPLFMVFFDTLHVREQVMAELYHYWPKIRAGGYAVFHDTEWGTKHDVYLGKEWGQPVEAVDAFFPPLVDTENYMRIDYKGSHGMTFVKKLTAWNPVVPGMDAALEDSKRLTEALCG